MARCSAERVKTSMEPIALTSFPNELLRKLAGLLSPSDASRLSQTCRALYTIIDDQSLWRTYFLQTYKNFPDTKEMLVAIQEPLVKEDWRTRFYERAKRDRAARTVFEGLLVTEHSRWDRIAEITESTGTECEDLLLPDRLTPHGFDDTLSRRYWATRTIAQARRQWAVDLWSIKSDEHAYDLPLLASAWDSFFLERPVYRIEFKIAYMANEITTRYPAFHDLESVDDKVKVVIDYLQEQNYVGERDVTQYHALHNNFLGHALQDPPASRSSMPLVSNLVFSAVCRKLDIATTLCNFPGHVYSAVWRSISSSQWIQGDTGPADFYVDPWRSNTILSHIELVDQFRSMHTDRPGAADRALEPMTGHTLLQRYYHNILNSVRAEKSSQVLRNRDFPADAILVGLALCQYLTSPRRSDIQMTQLALHLQSTPEDLALFRKLVAIKNWPYDSPSDPNNGRYRHEPNVDGQDLGAVRDDNGNMQIDPMLMIVQQCQFGRNDPIEPRVRTARIRYRVGQVFRHKRYSYLGVITGWDARCEQSREWQTEMGIAQLPGGDAQPYYHAQ